MSNICKAVTLRRRKMKKGTQLSFHLFAKPQKPARAWLQRAHDGDSRGTALPTLWEYRDRTLRLLWPKEGERQLPRMVQEEGRCHIFQESGSLISHLHFVWLKSATSRQACCRKFQNEPNGKDNDSLPERAMSLSFQLILYGHSSILISPLIRWRSALRSSWDSWTTLRNTVMASMLSWRVCMSWMMRLR